MEDNVNGIDTHHQMDNTRASLDEVGAEKRLVLPSQVFRVRVNLLVVDVWHAPNLHRPVSLKLCQSSVVML